MSEHKLRRRWRRKHVAAHFSVNIRTVDGWAKRGVIPKPHYMPDSKLPLWFADEFEKIDEAITAALKGRASGTAPRQ
jgi:hypothetical protein